MLRLPNLQFNSSNKLLPLPSNRLKKQRSLFKKQSRPELSKKSKTKSIEKMPSSLPCKRPKRKLKLWQRLPGKRPRRKPSLQDNGMLLWHKELSKREKIEKLLNLPFSKRLPKRRPIERLQKPKRRLKLKLREFMSKN